MKKLLPIAGLLLICGFAAPQDDGRGNGDVAKRVEALETEVQALRTELKATRALLDETSRYLESQARAAKDLQGTFDAAEKAGYTAGINFRSRELLLAGWRSYTGTLQKGVPGRKPGGKDDAPAER